jgi:hypothetical protein
VDGGAAGEPGAVGEAEARQVLELVVQLGPLLLLDEAGLLLLFLLAPLEIRRQASQPLHLFHQPGQQLGHLRDDLRVGEGDPEALGVTGGPAGEVAEGADRHPGPGPPSGWAPPRR